MRFHTRAAALILAMSMAGCIPEPPKPAPTPAPVRPTPVPSPTPVAPKGDDWRDWALTPGDWAYRQDARGSIALFGAPGQDAELTLRCDRLLRQVYLSRRGSDTGARSMTIRTTSMTRTLAALPTGGNPPYLASALAPVDKLLDAMGFSRGRFIIEVTGHPTLVVPAWAEVLRVTEDCRG